MCGAEGNVTKVRAVLIDARKSHNAELCDECVKPIKAIAAKVRKRRPMSESVKVVKNGE